MRDVFNGYQITQQEVYKGSSTFIAGWMSRISHPSKIAWAVKLSSTAARFVSLFYHSLLLLYLWFDDPTTKDRHFLGSILYFCQAQSAYLETYLLLLLFPLSNLRIKAIICPQYCKQPSLIVIPLVLSYHVFRSLRITANHSFLDVRSYLLTVGLPNRVLEKSP